MGPCDGEAVRGTARSGTPRKWALLTLLVEARDAVGLKPRQLDVLRGLLTFLPGDWPKPDGSVVFPANRTLRKRLNGMPESTLRRHLGRLVAAGVIDRRDSPSRKRYRIGTAPDLVFGFDLAPFFAMANRLAEAAGAARLRQRRFTEARARLRATFTRRHGEDLHDALRLVRRSSATLEELEAACETSSAEAEQPSETNARDCYEPPETSAPAAQIERPPNTINTNILKERSVVAVIETLRAWSGRDIGDHDTLVSAGSATFAAAGVQPTTWRLALEQHGPVWAALAVGYCLIRGDVVRKPDAYYAELIRRAGAGTFVLDGSPGAMC